MTDLGPTSVIKVTCFLCRLHVFCVVCNGTSKQTADLATLQQRNAAPLSVFFRTGLQTPRVSGCLDAPIRKTLLEIIMEVENLWRISW